MYKHTVFKDSGVSFSVQKYGSPSHLMRERVCIETCGTVTQARILCQMVKPCNCKCRITKLSMLLITIGHSKFSLELAQGSRFVSLM